MGGRLALTGPADLSLCEKKLGKLIYSLGKGGRCAIDHFLLEEDLVCLLTIGVLYIPLF